MVSNLMVRLTAWAKVIRTSYWEWKLMKASCKLDIHFLDDRRPQLEGGCWCEWVAAHPSGFPTWN